MSEATTADVSRAPIFIGGCDRSGTTMLGALLGSHPSCIVTPESPFKTDILARLSEQDDEGTRTIDLIRQSWRFQIWGHHLAVAGQPRSFAAALRAVVASYAVAHGRPSDARWVDHTPNNIRYALSLAARFPTAKFVHVVRDGRAVANSVMPLDWGPNTMLYAAPWWVERLAYGLAAESSLGEEAVLRVRYEDLLLAPELELRRIHGFLDLDESEVTNAERGYRSPDYTAGQHQLVGSAPDASRLDRFRRSLAARDIELFEWATKDLLPYLGYALDNDARARGPSRTERVRAALVEASRSRLNRLRNSRRRSAAVEGAAGA